jgi:hypothetical protein
MAAIHVLQKTGNYATSNIAGIGHNARFMQGQMYLNRMVWRVIQRIGGGKNYKSLTNHLRLHLCP